MTNRKAFLITGLWGYFLFSAGLHVLADKLRSIGIEAEVWSKGLIGYMNKRRIASACQQAYADGYEIILVGHSMGADEAVMVAEILETYDIPVSVLIGLDPTEFGCPLVPPNVGRALCLRGNDYGLGDGTFRARITGMPMVQNVTMMQVAHTDFDDDPDIHRRVVREVTR